MVHLAIYDEGPGVSPFCGAWGGSRAWTLERGGVSCPTCLRRLRAHEEALHLAPVSTARPDGVRLAPWPPAVGAPPGRRTR